MTSLALIMTSFAEEKTARAVVRDLLEERLIACGTIIPKAHSLYFWKEKIEEANEVFVLLKTLKSSLERCQKKLKELHPYEVPEIIVLEPCAVDPAYERWVKDELKTASTSQ